MCSRLTTGCKVTEGVLGFALYTECEIENDGTNQANAARSHHAPQRLASGSLAWAAACLPGSIQSP